MKIRQFISPGCRINQLSQPHGPGMGGELKTTGVTRQEIAHASPSHCFGKDCKGGSEHPPSRRRDPKALHAQGPQPLTSSSQTPNIQPTEMGPHPKHHSQMGHPAPLLPAPFGWAPLLLTPHPLRERPTTPASLGNHLVTVTPAPLLHISQPWGLSLDGGGFRGRMLNCIAQLSDLQSLLLAPTLPFPYPTTTGDAASSAP